MSQSEVRDAAVLVENVFDQTADCETVGRALLKFFDVVGRNAGPISNASLSGAPVYEDSVARVESQIRDNLGGCLYGDITKNDIIFQTQALANAIGKEGRSEIDRRADNAWWEVKEGFDALGDVERYEVTLPKFQDYPSTGGSGSQKEYDAFCVGNFGDNKMEDRIRERLNELAADGFEPEMMSGLGGRESAGRGRKGNTTRGMVCVVLSRRMG